MYVVGYRHIVRVHAVCRNIHVHVVYVHFKTCSSPGSVVILTSLVRRTPGRGREEFTVIMNGFMASPSYFERSKLRIAPVCVYIQVYYIIYIHAHKQCGLIRITERCLSHNLQELDTLLETLYM